jgi:hypothetical protein
VFRGDKVRTADPRMNDRVTVGPSQIRSQIPVGSCQPASAFAGMFDPQINNDGIARS